MKPPEQHVVRGIPANRYVVFLTIAILGCAADLLTKHYVFAWRGMPRENHEWWIWEGYVGIETALNSGALFGMGSGFGFWFALLSIVAAAGIVFWLFWCGAARDLLLTIALGCVMGGIFGNLYDRLGLWHDPAGNWHTEVRDWILLRYGSYTWPNFNLADSLLVSGAILLLWHGLKHDAGRPKETTPTAEQRG